MSSTNPQEVAEQRAAAAREQRLDRSAILLTADIWRELAHRIGPEPRSLTVAILPFTRYIHLTVLSADEATIVVAALRMERDQDRPHNGASVFHQWSATFHDVEVVLHLVVAKDAE